MPALPSRGAASSRIQAASNSAIAQRSTGAGLSSMRGVAGKQHGVELHHVAAAAGAGADQPRHRLDGGDRSSRLRQSDGSVVTSAELKSGPAASRKDCGSGQIGGRGRGSGTSSAAAMPPPSRANQPQDRDQQPH